MEGGGGETGGRACLGVCVCVCACARAPQVHNRTGNKHLSDGSASGMSLMVGNVCLMVVHLKYLSDGSAFKMCV